MPVIHTKEQIQGARAARIAEKERKSRGSAAARKMRMEAKAKREAEAKAAEELRLRGEADWVWALPRDGYSDDGQTPLGGLHKQMLALREPPKHMKKADREHAEKQKQQAAWDAMYTDVKPLPDDECRIVGVPIIGRTLEILCARGLYDKVQMRMGFNCLVRRLELNLVDLGDAGLERLCKVFTDENAAINRSLKYLGVAGNEITDHGLETLVTALLTPYPERRLTRREQALALRDGAYASREEAAAATVVDSMAHRLPVAKLCGDTF